MDVKLLKSLKRADKQDHGLPIEVQVGLRMETAESLGRVRRRLVDKEVRKLITRHGDLTHPETGERPTILFYMESLVAPGSIRIKTDSAKLREYLVSKGVAVHGETTDGDAGHAPAAEPIAAPAA